MTSLFKKKFMRVPHLSAGNAFREIGRNAFVDWIMVIIISLAVAGFLVAGGVYLYWQIRTGNFEVTSTSEQSDTVFDKQELDSLINHFQIRQDRSDQIKKGYKGPADPSL